MLKVPSFNILSPLREEREEKKPSAQMHFGEGNGFLVGAFLYVLELLRLSAVPWLVIRIDWGTAAKCCSAFSLRAQGVEQRCWGLFPSQLSTRGKLHFASAHSYGFLWGP